MPHVIHTAMTASVTDLKKNPMGTVAAGEGEAVAILNRNGRLRLLRAEVHLHVEIALLVLSSQL